VLDAFMTICNVFIIIGLNEVILRFAVSRDAPLLADELCPEIECMRDFRPVMIFFEMWLSLVSFEDLV
jgi:hypothetical protein